MDDIKNINLLKHTELEKEIIPTEYTLCKAHGLKTSKINRQGIRELLKKMEGKNQCTKQTNLFYAYGIPKINLQYLISWGIYKDNDIQYILP